MIVNTDTVIFQRRGLIYPLLDQKNRAERVASLDFVDYIVISPHGAQSSIVLESINPEFLLMQQDNTFFLKGIIEVVNNKFPGIKILVSNVPKDIKLPVLSTDARRGVQTAELTSQKIKGLNENMKVKISTDHRLSSLYEGEFILPGG